MTTLVWDIEADGLYMDVQRVHCIVASDARTGEYKAYRPNQIKQAIEYLDTADVLVAHNGMSYDHPVMSKLKNWRPKPSVEIIDTFVLAQLLFSDLENMDYSNENPQIRALAGSNTLEAWGVRLNRPKLKYDQGFEYFTEEMLTYCIGDVETTRVLYNYLKSFPYSKESLKLEQRISLEYEKMTWKGFNFDRDKAYVLKAELEKEIEQLTIQINTLIPPKKVYGKKPEYWIMEYTVDGETKTHQEETKGKLTEWRKSQGLKPKEHKVTEIPGPLKYKLEYFNPNSGKQVREYLNETHGWISPSLTDKGAEEFKKNPHADYNELAKQYGQTKEEFLRVLDYPEASLFADMAVIQKVYGMVSSGEKSYLSLLSPDGVMRCRIKGIGCVTHRTSISSPNLQQVPSVTVDKGSHEYVLGLEGRYGTECRDLFTATEGYVLVGTDLSGIEARMLAHYLKPFDGGSYMHLVLEGDIHQLNVDSFQKYAGYEIGRNPSKNIYYGWCYGAGDEKLGKMAVEVSSDAKAHFFDRLHSFRNKHNEQQANFLAFKTVGGNIRTSFERGITGFEELQNAVKSRAKRGYLSPLDGRRIPVRKEHAALNTLMQGSAAIVMKRWCVMLSDAIRRSKRDCRIIIPVHDELQKEARPEHTEWLAETAVRTIKEAGEYYNLNIPLSGEAKIASLENNSWKYTH